jgi:hypothetical protein
MSQAGGVDLNDHLVPAATNRAARPGVFEMTWDNDGRATFSYGAERITGEAHVVWRRIGTHAIFTPPPGP